MKMLNELIEIAENRGEIKRLWADRRKKWVRMNIKHHVRLICAHKENIQIFKRMVLEYLNHKNIPYMLCDDEVIFGKIICENNRYYISDMHGKHRIAKNWVENLKLLKMLHEIM